MLSYKAPNKRDILGKNVECKCKRMLNNVECKNVEECRSIQFNLHFVEVVNG